MNDAAATAVFYICLAAVLITVAVCFTVLALHGRIEWHPDEGQGDHAAD